MTVRALRVIAERREASRDRVREASFAAARAALGDRGDATCAIEAVIAAEAAGLAAAREAIDRAPRPACAAGCASCCHVHAEATRAEIEAIAAHLARTRGEGELAHLAARLAVRAREIEGLDDEARWAARVPCALLDPRGACSIHEVRPLRCRAFHSASAEPCREAFAGAEHREALAIPALARAYQAIEEGIDRALAEAGIEAAGELLESGLARALARHVSRVSRATGA